VLCGVGGRTIAEAQQQLSYPEFLSWTAYRRKRGSLHFGMRVEHAAATLASLYGNTKGGKFKIYDFMPHEDEPPVSLEAAMEAWR
jgi:hypothetical protein